MSDRTNDAIRYGVRRASNERRVRFSNQIIGIFFGKVFVVVVFVVVVVVKHPSKQILVFV